MNADNPCIVAFADLYLLSRDEENTGEYLFRQLNECDNITYRVYTDHITVQGEVGILREVIAMLEDYIQRVDPCSELLCSCFGYRMEAHLVGYHK